LARHEPRSPSLEDLFAQAERFGRVTIYSSIRREPNTYSCKIEFPTIEGTTLSAMSDFGLPLKDALREAIAKAHQIRNHFKDVGTP
jgi:hypothetical protein